ncbi:peptidase G2 autoproteolytic cleavage domain-containing protein [Paenibacillus sp. OV219]|uniref:peptidase G2 autoproteolytic cleavage domain-containing protein n=1 Tax=Paenibacillus sp. OV219 TaxID=1884377 RepID=UPI0008C6D14B|nr:peptidase G2 autoproteolytic cleavage domain-containing protein [Paenibacillus sp. OV219]SEO96654.1 Peptidase_G2, IMC autoproteolytic cleavage domain [Paenibacillus sp. OV219]
MADCNAQATGSCSEAEGTDTTASGTAAHAEGFQTTAGAFASHTEGYATQAIGPASHAEGGASVAHGLYGHAEGRNTDAANEAAHAEGYLSAAGGFAAHAEGYATQAIGPASHAEGGAAMAVGLYAHAEGELTLALGDRAHAEGQLTTASALNAHAEGELTQATGLDSHAEGLETIASGEGSHAEGESNTSSGRASHAEGNLTAATGIAAHAEGQRSQATGDLSHAEGSQSIASGQSSHAEGAVTTASGFSSHAQGVNTVADSSFSHAEGLGTSTNMLDGVHIMGQFGAANSLSYSWYLANGTSIEAPGLAAAILSTGDVKIDGSVSSPAADYAEMFETFDGNPIEPGYFLALAGDKVRIATAADPFLVGISSRKPAFLSGNAELNWPSKFLTDEWGGTLYHDVNVPALLDRNGHVLVPEHTEQQPQLNPAWDPSQPYIPRISRPEWVAVGMLGKLLVRDDGSCLPGALCKPANNGQATAAPVPGSGYYVLKRTAPNQVLILFGTRFTA